MAERTSSGGRWMALALQLGVALLVMTARVKAQGILTLGGCRGYQSAAAFDEAYIAKLKSASDGYAVVLTSERPRTSNCQRLTLYSNRTFLFTYNDDYNRLQNHSSSYTIEESSVTTPGSINLRMPVALFGATLTGSLRLNVLVAEDDYFVVASCWEPVPFLRSEFVHVFVPSATAETVSPADLQTALVAMRVPYAAQMREVFQGCYATPRFLDTQGKADLYNFLVKIGLAPPLPIRRLHEIRAGVPPTQFYDAAPNFIVPQPGYHYAPPDAVAPVQSFVYGPSSTASGTVSAPGQGHSFVYNAVQSQTSHLPQGVSSFVPLPSGFVPVLSGVNYDYQSFGYNSPGTFRHSHAVTNGVMVPVQSAPVISYDSPVASYPSTHPQTFSYNHPAVINYPSPSFG